MDVDSWVREQLNEGRSPAEIRADLRDAGWTADQIDRVMDRVPTTSADTSTLTIRIDRRYAAAAVLILSALLGFGIAWIALRVIDALL